MIVQVQEGRIRGVEKISVVAGQRYCAFLGIPYAQPPVGNLRFRAPVPMRKWENFLVASTEGSQCYQINPMSEQSLEPMGSEDCLYLNIYTPQRPSKIKNLRAVMVFIHGGGFYFDSGTAENYGPEYLITQNVIYVAINYRLHVFGFLNTGNADCPGNAGLKDQQLALKWIKTNIANFGGDPDNITIFGQSAGAISVHYHMLSPMSKGLFEKAILQSGNVRSPCARQKDPESLARRFGQFAGYRGQDLEGLPHYLRQLSGQKLCQLVRDEWAASGKGPKPEFIPSVEKIKGGAFLPDTPEKLFESATPIPAIVGFTSEEGFLKFSTLRPEQIHTSNLSSTVSGNFVLDEIHAARLTSEIEEFYFHNMSSSECIPRFVHLFTDLMYLKFYEAMNHLIHSDTPPYIYLFTHDGELNFAKKNIIRKRHPQINLKGACHGDDVGYVFSQDMSPHHTMNKKDVKVICHICSLWTSFAKTGKPTSPLQEIDWRPHTADRPSYLNIEDSLEVHHRKLLGERLAFWEEWSTSYRH